MPYVNLIVYGDDEGSWANWQKKKHFEKYSYWQIMHAWKNVSKIHLYSF